MNERGLLDYSCITTIRKGSQSIKQCGGVQYCTWSFISVKQLSYDNVYIFNYYYQQFGFYRSTINVS